jgi:putative acetyltransferase
MILKPGSRGAVRDRLMLIREGDLDHPQVLALLQEHLRAMHAQSPPESVHALDLRGLQSARIRFFTAWQERNKLSLDDAMLMGCAALARLDATNAELKSMRTAQAFRRQGVASVLLEHLVLVAKQSGYQRLSLETGAQATFAPARQLYLQHGFQQCAPFADYSDDPNSVFMTLAL